MMPPQPLYSFQRLIVLDLALAMAVYALVHAQAQPDLFSLEEVVTIGENHARMSHPEISDYYLAAIQKSSRIIKKAGSDEEKTQEYYELWWVKPQNKKSDYIGLAVTPAGQAWHISPSEPMRRALRATEWPPVSLKAALNLAEHYALQQSLIASTHYLYSANLVVQNRSSDEVYWYVWLKNRNGDEQDDVQLGIRMDGSVKWIGMM
ncbi:MAG: hypothetical protein FJ217_02580 [Ignavibacteria bacterium]|nr:hypothetical protein [Ignavibacteria bacterium]